MLLQMLRQPSAPPPSPDRTTGREQKGFASDAFTGKLKGGFIDAANGFYPDAAGAQVAGYGIQAGNPKQQRLAAKDLAREGLAPTQRASLLRLLGTDSRVKRGTTSQGPPPSPDRTTARELAGFASSAFTGVHPEKANGFSPSLIGGKFVGYGTQAGNPKQQAFARKMQLERGAVGKLASALGASPVGEVAGDIQANRTWAKLAPLFGRDPKKPPPTTFEDVSSHNAIGLESGGKVKLDPSLRDFILLGSKGVAETAAHEYAHTQQQGHGSGTRPEVEGGARAFENAVAPLLGYKPRHDPAARDKYGKWAQQNFSRPGPWKDPRNLRKTLIGQFPHAKQRMTSIRAQRPNLAQ